MVKEVKYTGMYGLPVDATPDLSWLDQLADVIRYVKETDPTKQLLALRHVSAKTGVATAEDMVRVLQESTFNTSQLVSQSHNFTKTI